MKRTDAAALYMADPLEGVRRQFHDLARKIDDEGNDDDGICERVLADVDFDGRRYLLVRLPVVERKGVMLSPRESEIVRLVADGHPNKVIAAVLEISSWTVGTHVRRVFAKLGVTSRAAMVARMIEFSGMEAARAPPSAPNRIADRLDNPGLRHAGGSPATPAYRDAAPYVQNRALSAMAHERERKIG
jgi:DNA-binding CsgD family transcriptional regulator